MFAQDQICEYGDCINGYGEIDIGDGDYTYKGEFKNGLPHGKGIYDNFVPGIRFLYFQ